MDYTIKNNYLTAQFNLMGGELKSLNCNGKEYMLNDERFWKYSSPLLFPVIGKLINDYTVIDGKRYDIPKHGIIRTSKFELNSIEENKISFIFKSSEESYKIYPYHFELILGYELIDKQINCSINIKNTSDFDMHFNVGLHPAFILDQPFDSYRVEFEYPENNYIPSVLPNGTLNFVEPSKEVKNLSVMPLNYKDYEVDAVIFRGCSSSYCKLLDKNNKGLEFGFKDFSTVAFWTPNNLSCPFICIEPWIGYASKHNDSQEYLEKDYLVKLEKYETIDFTYYFKIID